MRIFQLLGMRGTNTQSAMHDFDPRTGIIVYSQVAVNGVSCWNTAVPLSEQSHVLIDRNNDKMIYPSDLNVSTPNTHSFIYTLHSICFNIGGSRR